MAEESCWLILSQRQLSFKICWWIYCLNWWWYCLVHPISRSQFEIHSCLLWGVNILFTEKVGHLIGDLVDNYQNPRVFRFNWFWHVGDEISFVSLPRTWRWWQCHVKGIACMMWYMSLVARLAAAYVIPYDLLIVLGMGPGNMPAVQVSNS